MNFYELINYNAKMIDNDLDAIEGTVRQLTEYPAKPLSGGQAYLLREAIRSIRTHNQMTLDDTERELKREKKTFWDRMFRI